MNFSTIAAVSTPRGKGGVALLRVSGQEAFRIAEQVFRPFRKEWDQIPPRTQVYGEILSADKSAVLDDGLICLFPGPHSFTGEDVVEICCHGGEVVTAAVLEALLSSGAVMAGPGEFSRRALLNGKMTLTAAEGVADLLDAPTQEAVKLSSKAARGALSGKIDAIATKLLDASASLWAYLDYPEEDLQALSDEELAEKLREITFELSELTESFRAGRAVNSGVRGVILGKPNAGKSSFFNALLGEERAIVTDTPGTTRDTIDAPLHLGRVLVNLWDTAGIRSHSQDPIEKIGIDRSMESVKSAEVLFVLFDQSVPLDENDELVLTAFKEKSEDAVVIPVITKTDLPPKWRAEDLPLSQEPLFLSFAEKSDLSSLIRRVEEAFITNETLYREGAVLSNARQKASLERAKTSVEKALLSLESGGKDLASLDLEEALAALRETDGKSAGEEIINAVFSRFCVGK